MFNVDDDFNIVLRQGDSGKLTIGGLDDYIGYTLYLSVYDADRNIIFEINKLVEGEDVELVFSPSNTNLLTVPAKKKTAIYYFGLKICLASDDFEDTLIIDGKGVDDLNKVVVYPLITEGTLNGND